MKQQPAADDEVASHLRALEARIDDAVRVIERLRQENHRLGATLEESKRQRSEVMRKLSVVIDRIDTLL